jgi:hypothetical protein
VFENCVVLDEKSGEDGTLFRVRADERALERLRSELARQA